MLLVLSLFCVVVFLLTAWSFNVLPKSSLSRHRHPPSMEYIPDGLSKKQWDELKKKEQEEIKKKEFAKVGITKFQSRSFEAFQKAGMTIPL